MFFMILYIWRWWKISAWRSFLFNNIDCILSYIKKNKNVLKNNSYNVFLKDRLAEDRQPLRCLIKAKVERPKSRCRYSHYFRLAWFLYQNNEKQPYKWWMLNCNKINVCHLFVWIRQTVRFSHFATPHHHCTV